MDQPTPIPQTWEELVALREILANADRNDLRLVEEIRDYKTFCEIIPRDLQITLLLKQMGDQDTALLVNRYPYTRLLSKLPHVKHWALWCKSRSLTDEEIAEVVSKKFPDKRWMAVESNVKSMPEIWHTHVFVEN